MSLEVSEDHYQNLLFRSERCIGHVIEERAKRIPQHEFLFFEDEWLTYQQINVEANRVLEGLSKLGVRRGDHIAVLMNSSPQYLHVWIAISKLGAVEIPINSALKGALLVNILNDSAPRLIITDQEFQDVVLEATAECPSLELCVVNSPQDQLTEMEIDVRSLRAILMGEGNNPSDGPAPDDLACIMFTSGTTGPSKGVMLCHQFQLAFGLHFAKITKLKNSDIIYNFLPFFHIAGKFIAIAAILLDAKMILRQRFSVSAFWQDVREHKVTKSAAVGGICHMLYSLPRQFDDANNTLEILYATPVPAEIQAEFESRFNLQFVEAFGSTEMNLIAHSVPGATPKGSFGKPAFGYDVRIFDENDCECPDGVSGEIVVRHHLPNMIASGYYNKPEENLKAFRNLWFHSGDRGYRDEDGWFYFQDRISDSMRRRGENISSYEIERIVNTHEDVSECAAIAVPSDYQEDEIKLVVVKNAIAELIESDILEFSSEHLPYFMIPRYIELVNELPRTPLKKIKKSVLRERGITPETWDYEKNGYKLTRNGIVKV